MKDKKKESKKKESKKKESKKTKSESKESKKKESKKKESKQTKRKKKTKSKSKESKKKESKKKESKKKERKRPKAFITVLLLLCKSTNCIYDYYILLNIYYCCVKNISFLFPLSFFISAFSTSIYSKRISFICIKLKYMI